MNLNHYRIPVEYITGHVRDAELDLHLTDEEVEEYNNLTNDREKVEYLEDKGDLVITDYRTDIWSLDMTGYKKLKKNGESKK